jgi:nucleoid-associated protein YgaU
MKKILIMLFAGFICVYLTGCSGWLVRTSSSRQERVDQVVSGNRGFISGKPTSPPKEPTFKERKVFRFEIELPHLRQKEKAEPEAKEGKKERKAKEEKDQGEWGNRGYLVGSAEETAGQQEKTTVVSKIKERIMEVYKRGPKPAAPERTYTAKKGDTLQKISRKFYGTTKRWPLLYKANKDRLKSPDKVYPGQVLLIPETAEFKK